MADTQTNQASIGLGGLLFLLFTYLKLTNYIDWSWWWVTAPLWIPLGLVFTIMLVVGIVLAARS